MRDLKINLHTKYGLLSREKDECQRGSRTADLICSPVFLAQMAHLGLKHLEVKFQSGPQRGRSISTLAVAFSFQEPKIHYKSLLLNSMIVCL